MQFSLATAILVFISFFLFMLLMKQIFFGPISALHKARQAKVEDDRLKAEQLKADQHRLEQGYEQGLKEAKRKAQALFLEQRQVAKSKAALQVSEARKQAFQRYEQELHALQTWQQDSYGQLSQHRSDLVEQLKRKLLTTSSQA